MGKRNAISTTLSILSNPIEYLKGVGPQRADLLKKELGIFTFGDLLNHFPFRHIDRTVFHKIGELNFRHEYVQVTGKIINVEFAGEHRKKRMIAHLADGTGILELVWFQGLQYLQKTVQVGNQFIVFGKLSFFKGTPQISHPEIDLINGQNPEIRKFLEPVYSSTEKLTTRGLGGKQIGKYTRTLLEMIRPQDIPDFLPDYIISDLKLISRYRAYHQIHFPASEEDFKKAAFRLKFDELFLSQLRLGLTRAHRHRTSKGVVFEKVGELFNEFYANHLPFELTGAQKRVIKEIRKDMGSGHQMNRLLQGDVGSGKTIVALLSMLIACDNQFQACLMAPTEILSQQHYQNIVKLLGGMPVNVRLLTGSVKGKERKVILEGLQSGDIHMVVGTHALLEDAVKFKNLGLAIVDEQHRFGVAQRAKLWKKAPVPPHILVMTATPIPRTLAMTAYGDLDYSIIDELPPNRKPVITVHRSEHTRPQVMNFIRSEIEKGCQAYIIFPLIEESEKLDYENLMKGYENVKSWFPEPKFWISMVHGKMPPEVKEENMQRFNRNDTQIMVATTVIEVGVDVPNATVMVIESAERFGLSQLHQLRGRVGRGSEKSYCILLTGNQISKDAKERLEVMCKSNDGFVIAEKDLELRGPGEIEGTRQSGTVNFKIADITKDQEVLTLAREFAGRISDNDPQLNAAQHSNLRSYLLSLKGTTDWSMIS